MTVQGMGGVGKTSLAVEYAHRFRGLYAGVCWGPSETRTGLLSALAGLAVTLGAATTEEADVEKAAKAALRRLAEQRATWLLVYDNVSSPEEIADLLPSAGAKVLITSRFSDWSGWAEEVALDVLPLEEAVALLQSRTGRSDAADAKTLAEALGRLPLALDHAAAYCKRTQMSLADYALQVDKLIDEAPRGLAYPRSVGATFDLAIAQAGRSNRSRTRWWRAPLPSLRLRGIPGGRRMARAGAAEALMAYFAQCAPERIPMTLVEGAVEDEVERMEALAALAEVSLVKHDPFEDGTQAVTVHRLVQAIARARSQAKSMSQGIIERFISRLLAIYPKDACGDPNSWPLCAQLTPHLLAWRAFEPDRTLKLTAWAELLHRSADYFFGRQSFTQGIPLARDAVAIREQALGPEHLDTASSLFNLANLLYYQGDIAEARPLYERALAICEKVLGSEHPITAMSLNHLAGLLNSQGDLAAARLLSERGVAIQEKAFGPEHLNTARSLNNLAHVLHDQGDLAAARPLYERALAIEEKALGPEHPVTADSLNDVARLLQDEGDLAAARPLYERALAIDEKAFGPEDPNTGRILNNLADLLADKGDFAGARPLRERALAILEKAVGSEHPGTNQMRCILSRLLLLSGQPTEALALGETALAAHDKVLGRDHAWTKDSAHVTADALDALGRTEEAKALREKYGLTEAEKPKAS